VGVVLDTIAAAGTLIWLYLLLARGNFWRVREPDLSPCETTPSRARVAVIVPARNEADVVARTVTSLVCQNYSGPLHIFLIDDDSQDCTADSAARAAEKTGRRELLSVFRAPPLPSGWTGKLWAISEGIRQAERFHPDYLFFSDADIVHSPDNLSALVARAESGRYDLVSLMVMLQCRSVAEKLLIPAFVFFFFKLYPPRWIESPSHAAAGAAGGCILVRAPALARIGGIAAIRAELIDDCALAKAVKSTGGRVWLGITSATRSIRGYGTFSEIGRMISRTAFRQLGHSNWLLLGTLIAMFVTYLTPPLLLFTFKLLPVALGLFAWSLMTVAYTPTLRFYGLSIFWAPLLPLVALFYLGATIHSAVNYWKGAGGIWKGRVQDSKGEGSEAQWA
jgi:hopene-associated glycosyltransferase HpnB